MPVGHPPWRRTFRRPFRCGQRRCRPTGHDDVGLAVSVDVRDSQRQWRRRRGVADLGAQLPVPGAEPDAHTGALVDRHDVQLVVAVQIGERERPRRVCGVVDPGGELPLARSPQHAQAGSGPVRHHDVGGAVAVQITDRQRVRARSRGVVDLGLESPIPDTEQHAHRLVVPVDRDRVRFPIPIQIRDRHPVCEPAGRRRGRVHRHERGPARDRLGSVHRRIGSATVGGGVVRGRGIAEPASRTGDGTAVPAPPAGGSTARAAPPGGGATARATARGAAAARAGATRPAAGAARRRNRSPGPSWGTRLTDGAGLTAVHAGVGDQAPPGAAQRAQTTAERRSIPVAS